MRNVWKGLTVGAFAGAAVGITLDGLHKAADVSARAASGVSNRAKSGATHLAEVVEEKIDDIDTDEMVKAAKKGIDQAVETGKGVAKSTRKQGKKALKQGRKAAKKGIDQAVETGKEVVESTRKQGKKALKQGRKAAKKGIDPAVDWGKEVVETAIDGAGEAVDQTKKVFSRT